MCARFGASPGFIFCSATIGNPGELAASLTGLPVETVTTSGAPAGARHFLFLNPEQSAATTAVMHLDTAIVRPECQEVTLCNQLQSLPRQR